MKMEVGLPHGHRPIFFCFFPQLFIICKVRKRAMIRNRYNQAPHLTQDTNGKVTTSQLDITIESQEVIPFPAGDNKASQTCVHESITKQDRNNINDPLKNHLLGTVRKNILLEGLNRFNGAPTSPLFLMRIKPPKGEYLTAENNFIQN